MKREFFIKDTFYINEEEIKLISGAVHYFRTVPEHWKDRLEKLKALGCNAVETYIPWNLHEPSEDEYEFSDMCDLEKFIKLADKLDLFVILRPGPYICAEFEFGGLPAWLLKDRHMRVRSTYPPFIKAVERYFDVLLPIVSKYQIHKGGPVIMVQIENEYGYYGDDKEYLEAIRDMVKRYIEVPLITSDGPWNDAVNKGSVKEALQTLNFGSFKEEYRSLLPPNRPFLCSEFWIGWFDHWGGYHSERDPVDVKNHLKSILEIGHVNFYMFHGGTNFGFLNGSNELENQQSLLKPITTSYDYDALLTECGDLTKKYYDCREIIGGFKELPEVEFEDSKKSFYGYLECTEKVSLFELLEDGVKSISPISMENLDQAYGYVLYRTHINAGDHSIDTVGSDRIQYFLNGELIETRYDSAIRNKLLVHCNEEHSRLDLLVENMGRVNFGKNLNNQSKGLRQLIIDDKLQDEFTQHTFPLDNVDFIDFEKDYYENTPAFYKFELHVNEACDTYLDTCEFTKGVVFVNGFNIGRFWSIGPQSKLYIPGPLLNKGNNEIIIFESEGHASETIKLTDEPD